MSPFKAKFSRKKEKAVIKVNTFYRVSYVHYSARP